MFHNGKILSQMKLLRISGQPIRDLRLYREFSGETSNIQSLVPKNGHIHTVIMRSDGYSREFHSYSEHKWRREGGDRGRRGNWLYLSGNRTKKSQSSRRTSSRNMNTDLTHVFPALVPGVMNVNVLINPLNAEPIGAKAHLEQDYSHTILPVKDYLVLEDREYVFDEDSIMSLERPTKHTLGNAKQYEIAHIFKHFYMRNTPIKADVFVELAGLYLKSIPGQSVEELIESYILLTSYVDSGLDIVKYMLYVVGVCLERKVPALINLESEKLVKLLAHMTFFQRERNIRFGLLTNEKIFDAVISNRSLTNESKGLLFSVLASLDLHSPTLGKYASVYDDLSSLVKHGCGLSYDAARMLVSISDKFEHDYPLTKALFTCLINSGNNSVSGILANAVLKFKDKESFIRYDFVITKIMGELIRLPPELIANLYCHHLKYGVTENQDRKYEEFISLKKDLFNVHDISNIVTQLSLRGGRKSEICSHLLERFLELSEGSKITVTEALDCILSFSLVGMTRAASRHFGYFKAVYCTSKRQLAHLAYVFLSCDMREPDIWKILLFRIANECEHSADLYETIKAAMILGHLPSSFGSDSDPSNLKSLLHKSRLLYKKEQTKPVSHLGIPYRSVFQHMGLSYKRMIFGDLYTFQYVFDNLNLVLEMVKARSEATGYLTDDWKLRRDVLKKLGYELVFVDEKSLDKFRDPDGYYDARQIAEFFLSLGPFARLISRGILTR